MKKILSAVAALLALIATPALAASVTPPTQVTMITVQLGELSSDATVPMVKGTAKVVVQLAGCQAKWATGQDFYALATPGAPVVLVRKDLLDYAWTKSEENWDVAFQALVNAKLVCAVVDVKK